MRYFAVVAALCLVLALSACGLISHESTESQQSGPTSTPTPQSSVTPTPKPTSSGVHPNDKLKTPKPSLVCGKDGWSYLVSEYFGTNCASCHNANGFAPDHFAASDPDLAYSEAKALTPSVLLQDSAQNKFCGSSCSITVGSEVYNAIQEWTQNETCP